MVLEPPLNILRYLVVLSLLFVFNLWARADSLGELSESFWQWRAQEQPFTSDDIPRIDRPAGLTCRLVRENDRAADAAACRL